MKLPNMPKVLAATYNPVSKTKMFSVMVDFPTVLLAELRTHRIITQGAEYEHCEIIDISCSANCLHPDTEITIEYSNSEKLSGKQIKISDLYNRFVKGNCNNICVRNLNEETGRISKTNIKSIWKTKEKSTYKLTLSNGNFIICTDEHRIYSENGWFTLKDLELKVLSSGMVTWKNNDFKVATNGVEYDISFFKVEKENKKTLTQICNENGYNFKSASRFCEDNNFYFRKHKNPNETLEYKNKDWLLTMLKTGVNNAYIANVCNTSIDKVKKSISKLGLKGNRYSFKKGSEPWNKGLNYKIESESGKLGHSIGAAKRKRKFKSEVDKIEFNIQRRLITANFTSKILKENNYNCSCPITKETNCIWNAHHIVPVKVDSSKCFDESNMILISEKAHKWIHSNKIEVELENWILEKGIESLSDFLTYYNEIVNKPIEIFNKQKSKLKKGLFAKYFSIEKIELAETIECYDIEVEGEFKNFVANNIIVHNSARAIPHKKYVERVLKNPFIPVWTEQQKGMSGKGLSEEKVKKANQLWLDNLKEKESVGFMAWKDEYGYFNSLDKSEKPNKKDYDLNDPEELEEYNEQLEYYKNNVNRCNNNGGEGVNYELETLKSKYDELIAAGVHKQNANRLLAPFAYTTCILTGTEWSNFFSLRNPKYNIDIETIKENQKAGKAF